MLIHCGNAGGLRIPGPLEVDLLAVQIHFTLFCLVNPGDDFDECGFAGAILAHQCMHFSGLQLELNFVQRLDAGEDFCNPLQLKDILRFWHCSASISSRAAPPDCCTCRSTAIGLATGMTLIAYCYYKLLISNLSRIIIGLCALFTDTFRNCLFSVLLV